MRHLLCSPETYLLLRLQFPNIPFYPQQQANLARIAYPRRYMGLQRAAFGNGEPLQFGPKGSRMSVPICP